jgi:hypothetical protein
MIGEIFPLNRFVLCKPKITKASNKKLKLSWKISDIKINKGQETYPVVKLE